MIVGIDHIVILVADLEEAMRAYSALGFNVVPGGEHADGLSHNALIAFADAAYIELIAFKSGEVPESHPFYRPGLREGLVTFALLPDDIERTVREAKRWGLAMQGPAAGGRIRPDGVALEWKIATPLTSDLPFLCWDVTPRDLRVPSGEARNHPNGITGIGSISVSVRDLATSQERYSGLLGEDPLPENKRLGSGVAAFTVGSTMLFLMHTEHGNEGISGFQFECDSTATLDYFKDATAPGLPMLDIAVANGDRVSMRDLRSMWTNYEA